MTTRMGAGVVRITRSCTGDVWVLTAGKMILGTWSRNDDQSVSVYTDAEGKQITLTPGTTWVELPRPGTAELR